MPHFYRVETEDDCDKIKLLKAELEITEEGKVLNFEEVSDQERVSLFTRLQEIEDCGQVRVQYASYDAHHCCYYCYGVHEESVTENIDLCLMQLKEKSLGDSEQILVEYKLSYWLQTCFKVCLISNHHHA